MIYKPFDLKISLQIQQIIKVIQDFFLKTWKQQNLELQHTLQMQPY